MKSLLSSIVFASVLFGFLFSSLAQIIIIEINNGEGDCTIAAPTCDTLQDAINLCNTTERVEEKTCEIQIKNVLFGEGNRNIIIDSSLDVDSLRIRDIRMSVTELSANIQNGFFMHISNPDYNVSFEDINIGYSTTTALTIESERMIHLKNMKFQECTSNNNPSALYLTPKNDVVIEETLTFQDCKIFGNGCGSMRVDAVTSTNITLQGLNQYGLIFLNTIALNVGGGLCVFALGSPIIPISVQSSRSQAVQKGGTLALFGAAHYHIYDSLIESSGAQYGAVIYADGFSSLQITGLTATDNLGGLDFGEQGIFVKSHTNNSELTIHDLSIESYTSTENGGCLYVESLDSVIIENSTFTLCDASYGVGGAILVKDVKNLSVLNTEFDFNEARQGSSISCIDGDNSGITRIENVFFSNSVSTSLAEATIDVYSDGSCLSEFWNSRGLCEDECAGCLYSVCGNNQQFGCACYCTGQEGCEYVPTPSASSSPSPTPSMSASNQGYDTATQSEDNSSIGMIIVLSILGGVLGIVVIIMLIGLGVLVFYSVSKYREQTSITYDPINSKAPLTPQRDTDQYQNTNNNDNDEGLLDSL